MSDREHPETNHDEQEEPVTTATAETDDEEKEFEFVEDPVFDIAYKGNCAYEIKVTIPAANKAKKAGEVFEELQTKAEVPGFRRGRVPRKLIERKFGKAVRDEVVEKLTGAAFLKLVKDQDLRPLSFPEVEGVDAAREAEPESPLDLVFKFEVMPRVTLGPYKEVEVERPVVTVEESDVDEAINDMRQRFAVYETAPDAEAADGDQVIIDFHGQVDGQEFPGNRAENYPYILGTKRFFPEFEQALQGAKTGAAIECDVRFGEDYRVAELSGKTAHFTIKINEIKRRQTPELTDELANQAGYKSVADMRAKIGDSLRRGSSAQSDQVAETVALTKIVEQSAFEFPESMIESIAKENYEEEVQRLRRARMPAGEIETREAALREEARQTAEAELKQYLVLREIARVEQIKVSDADFEAEVEAITRRTGAEQKAVRGYLEEKEHRDEYAERLLRRKALALVMQHARITDKELPSAESEASDEQD